MRNLQEQIIELDEWRSTKKDIPSSLPSVKSYDIIVYSMATEECQDLASWFEENARKDLAGMMDLYENPLIIYKGMFNGMISISRKIIQFQSPCLSKLKNILKRLRWRFK